MLRCIFLLSALVFMSSAAVAAEPVSVMVIGTVHWSNPDRDLHNVKVDDVLAPKRQAEIVSIAQSLSRFHPTQIAVEWPSAEIPKPYDDFLKGTMKPSHNEVVQLGFRLAKANNASVHGIDVDGDFPYDAVENYAKAHDQQGMLTEADDAIVRQVKMEQALIDSGTISGLLRWLNAPANEDSENAFNRLLMKVGGRSDQPSAELFAAWAKRNALIWANLLQLAKPATASSRSSARVTKLSCASACARRPASGSSRRTAICRSKSPVAVYHIAGRVSSAATLRLQCAVRGHP